MRHGTHCKVRPKSKIKGVADKKEYESYYNQLRRCIKSVNSYHGEGIPVILQDKFIRLRTILNALEEKNDIEQDNFTTLKQ